MRICQTRISRGIRQETDHIITVLRIPIREYTIAGNHLMMTSEHTAKEIEQKARKVIGMLKRGVKFTPTQPDVMAILEKLKK